MTSGVGRLHRLVLLLIALVLLTAGVAALLAGLGVFGEQLPGQSVFDNPIGRYTGAHGRWLWPVLALAGLLLAYLAARWLLTLFRLARVSRIDLTSRDPIGGTHVAGRTGLDSAALSAALATQVRGYRDVTSAAAKIQGDASTPYLALTVTTTVDADLTVLRQRIEAEALVDLRRALQRPDLTVRLDLQISRTTGPRTH